MKKKGSALVFSVLILAFFLAIALNIFFIARNKAARASVKVQGEVTTNNIDIASSLGYQELQLAEKFVREGFPYDDANLGSIDSYIFEDKNKFYIDLSSGFYSESYSGIQLNNFIDYFSSQWDLGSTSSQKLIIGEEISGGKVISRIWQSAGIENKLTPLWMDNIISPKKSIGGYQLLSPSIDASTDVSTTDDTVAIYQKFIRLEEVISGSVTIIPESVFRIEITETFSYSITGGVASVSNRKIESFIIEAIE